MQHTPEQLHLREQYLLALLQATFPLQQSIPDREVSLGLLIEAADLLKSRLQSELDELRTEHD